MSRDFTPFHRTCWFALARSGGDITYFAPSKFGRCAYVSSRTKWGMTDSIQTFTQRFFASSAARTAGLLAAGRGQPGRPPRRRDDVHVAPEQLCKRAQVVNAARLYHGRPRRLVS